MVGAKAHTGEGLGYGEEDREGAAVAVAVVDLDVVALLDAVKVLVPVEV